MDEQYFVRFFVLLPAVLKWISYSLLIMLIGLSSYQCRKDIVSTNPNDKLEFNKDTIIFDTVFTTIGSTTQQLRIYNRNTNKLIISSVELAGGASSPFRINLDGVAGTNFSDIEIEARDSLYMFAEVTLEANNLTNPLIIEDSIIFTTNGNRQAVKLVVWGQDAYFHVNEIVQGTWQNDKPHVIYGTAAVGFPGLDSNLTLNIPAGTNVHVHANSRLYVYKSTLNVNGTEGNEVIFQGDRLEPYYQDIPGQWDGIWLIHSEQSTITHAIVKNGERGIWAYKTNPGSSNPALILNNTECIDNAFSGIWCDESFVIATNNLFANNGSYCGVFVNGGTYNFNHCTFGNYWNQGTRTTPAFRLNNFYDDPSTPAVDYYIFPITSTVFENCVMYGSLDEEFQVDTLSGAPIDFEFRNTLVKTLEMTTSNSNYYQNILKNNNPSFVNGTEGNYHLNAGSACINFGNLNNPGTDIDEGTRDASGDIGCYEYQ